MPTNNAINLSQAGIVRYDGAGTFTGEALTQYSLLAGNASNHIYNIGVATDGQIPIGNTGNFPTLGTLTAGTGVSISNAPGSITINCTSSGFTWNDVTGTTANMLPSNGYLADNASAVNLNLPAVCPQFGMIWVKGFGAGGWRVSQASGQTIIFGTLQTTSGASGFLTATNRYDGVLLMCVAANTTFMVMGATGNITIN